MIKLISVDKLKTTDYNPRRADPERMKLVELSLRKLGFLLPLYINIKGDVLSGNQRHRTAMEMGVKEVPVDYIPVVDDETEKTLNIIFNKATNDMSRYDTTQSLLEALKEVDIYKIAEPFPDIEINTPEFYPCMDQKLVKVNALVKKNVHKMDQYSRNVTYSLFKYKIKVPVIITKKGDVINGIGRVHTYAEKGIDKINCVILPEEKAEMAKYMLNLLSMDFEMHDDYKDILRYNSFMRPATTRGGLACGMYIGCFPNRRSKEMKYFDKETIRRYKEYYGTSILDFGAGKFVNTHILRSIGLDVSAFEPFPMEDSKAGNDGKKVSRVRAKQVATNFLEEVRTGKRWDTIFIASVFNSIPFRADREKVARICAALTDPQTQLHIFTMSRLSPLYTSVQRDLRSKTNASSKAFLFDYEDATIMSNVNHMKVQKFHTPGELKSIVDPLFKYVDVKYVIGNTNVLAICRGSILDYDKLVEALEFEFNLPYPDGKRLGMVDEAIAAFDERLELNRKLGYLK